MSGRKIPKPCDLQGYKAFYKYVMDKSGERFDLITSNGYKLFPAKRSD